MSPFMLTPRVEVINSGNLCPKPNEGSFVLLTSTENEWNGCSGLGEKLSNLPKSFCSFLSKER